MEFRTLEYFVAVAEEASFTRAAARCRVVQPAISQQIQSLERELGEPLFERQPKRITLTAGGRALLPHARECLAAAASAVAEFASRAGRVHGELRVGTVSGVQDTLVPRALGELRRQHPGVAVQLTSDVSSPLLDLVRSKRLDVAVLAAPPTLPAGIAARTLLEDHIVGVVATSGPLARRRRLSLDQIAGQTIISYAPSSGLERIIRGAFEARQLGFEVAYACNDVAIQVALAEQAIGVALSAGSDPAIGSRPGAVAIPLTPALPYRKIIVWRESSTPSAPLRAFLTLVGQLLDASAAAGDKGGRAPWRRGRSRP